MSRGKGLPMAGMGPPQPPPAPMIRFGQTQHLLGTGDWAGTTLGTSPKHRAPSTHPQAPMRDQGLNPAPPIPMRDPPSSPPPSRLSATHPGTDENEVFPLRFILFLLENDAQFVLHPL